jgi:hypothetical protein
MKPETIMRRAAERQRAIAERRATLRARLQEKAREEGPDSIYAELLQEAEGK